MFGLGRGASPNAEWKKLVAKKRPVFMSRGEKIKMALVVGGLLAFLGAFYELTGAVRRLGRTNAPELATAGRDAAPARADDEAARAKEREWAALWEKMKRDHDLPRAAGVRSPSSSPPTAAPPPPPTAAPPPPAASAPPPPAAAAPPPPAPALSAEEKRREAAKREEWERVKREYGLPEGFDLSALPPIDAGLLLWVDDGSAERERAPYEHLLRYTLSRTQEELDAEARKDASFEWLRRRDLELDARMARSKALRGTVVTVYGTVLSSYERRLDTAAEGEALRPWVWEAVIRDKDGVAFLVVSPDKQVEAEAGDVVKVSGPYFKLLRVRTEDGKDRGFPLIVARALRRVEEKAPRPRLFSNALLKVLAVLSAIALAAVVVLWVRQRRAPPPEPRRRSRLHNERLRSLDRTAGSGEAQSVREPETPSALGSPSAPDTQAPESGTDATQ